MSESDVKVARATFRRSHGTMNVNAWCMGARRRGAVGGAHDEHDPSSLTSTSSSAHNASSTATSPKDGHHQQHQHQDLLHARIDREMALRRGTRRARVCLVITCILLFTLAMTRPLYGPYIDVFGPREEQALNATLAAAGPSETAKLAAAKAFEERLRRKASRKSIADKKRQQSKVLKRKIIG
jgi:hypothetical protein